MRFIFRLENNNNCGSWPINYTHNTSEENWSESLYDHSCMTVENFILHNISGRLFTQYFHVIINIINMFNIVIHLYILVYHNMPTYRIALSTETADCWFNKLAFCVQWKRYERGFQLENLSWTHLMFVSSSWCLALHAHHKLEEHRNENHCQDQRASTLPENMQERWKKWQNKTVQTKLSSRVVTVIMQAPAISTPCHHVLTGMMELYVQYVVHTVQLFGHVFQTFNKVSLTDACLTQWWYDYVYVCFCLFVLQSFSWHIYSQQVTLNSLKVIKLYWLQHVGPNTCNIQWTLLIKNHQNTAYLNKIEKADIKSWQKADYT